MSKIKNVHARQIIDSRGNPTVEAIVTTSSGAISTASVPSGASTGKYEAVELRDNDKNFFLGKSVLNAVNKIKTILNNELSSSQLDELATKYRLKKPTTIEDLLTVIDILPPSLVLAQAANESNWGRSRFAEDFNNYFGIWCFVQGCGTVPKQRDANANHEVANFNSLKACIDYYVLTINRNYAYQDLRLIRKAHRDELKPRTGIALAEGLGNYAYPGDEYISSIQSVIRYNQLERYDLFN